MNWSGKCEGPGGGDRRGALCTGFTLDIIEEPRIIIIKKFIITTFILIFLSFFLQNT